MTEGTTLGDHETVIKIDGVEYGVCPHQTADCSCKVEGGTCPPNHFQVEHNCYAPKRVQTGWVCRGCASTCYVMQSPPHHYPDAVGCGCGVWHPFYGKVLE